MASALEVSEDEFDDLTQCSICQEEYNNEDRIPKFLNCTHTFCLKCIKGRVKNKIISCPICRDITPVPSTVSDMKTNSYILRHIEVRGRKTETVRNFLWCFPCGKAAQLQCNPSGHKLLMVENSRVYQELKQLNEDINTCKTNWSLSIQCRRQFQQSVLDHVYKSFKIVQDQLNNLMEDNDLHVAQEESLLIIAEKSLQQNAIDIHAVKETYAKSARESRKHLQDSELFIAQFDAIRHLRCNLISTANSPSNCNTDKIIDFSFDENQPNITIVTFAMAPMLKTVLPAIGNSEPTAASGPEKKSTREKFSEAKTRTKSVNGYATVLHQSPSETEQNGQQVTSPLSSGQVHCFIKFEVDGVVFGRQVTILLEVKAAPMMCEAFINTCLGKNGKYKDTHIFQRKKAEYICGGKMEETGMAKMYAADDSFLKEELGVIRMRRMDEKQSRVYVGTEFHVILSRGPYKLLPYTTVFGRVFDGLDICEQVSYMNPFVHDIRIAECGVF